MAVLISSDCHRQPAPAEIPPSPTSVICQRLHGLVARIFLCTLLIWLAPSAVRAQTKEYQVKAAFLYNFAQFVSWPDTAFTNADEPFQIGVLGENPFGGDLNETIHGEAIHGHKMVILEARQVENLAACQIIFISKAEAAHADEIFTKLGSKPVLTVSEASGFARRGGMINFYRDGTKVRFEINPDAAGKSGLKLSSELLSVGKIIHSEGSPK